MKNGWKKTLSLLLCLVLLAGLFPAALAEGEMCTVTFSTDGGHYLNPITAEKGAEITLPKAVWDNHCFLGWSLEYNGDVDYQAGGSLVLSENLSLYAIWRDSQPLGLYAYWADTGESYAETTVPLNGSITLRVEAGVSAGELSYEWSCYGMDPSLLPGESSNIFTIDVVDKHYYIQCIVRDMEGNAITLSCDLSTDTGLWARSADTGEKIVSIKVPMMESITLRVEAGVNLGELRYRWYRADVSSVSYPGNVSNTLTLESVNEKMTVMCQVTDDYENSQYVQFNLSPDTGFWARAGGTADTYAEITVKKGESVTLTVEAGVDIGDLHYEWDSPDLDASLLPQNDSTASFTIPSVDRHYDVYCDVSDDYGNRKYITFDVSTDTSLQAWAAGTNSGYVEYTIQKGDNVTLAVDARVDEGGLRYRWGSSQQDIRKLLPQDEKTPSFTLENLRQPCYIYCNVYDDEGNSKNVAFRIYTDTGLRAYVAGTQTNSMRYTVPAGESVTLAVDAHVNEGGLRYRWYCIGDSSPAGLPADESTTSFTLAKVEKAYEIRCAVYDDDGNYKTVFFDVFPDTGLRAWIEGGSQDSDYRRYEVPLGDSLTLSIKAETNGGNLHYSWECYEGEAPGLPTDDQTASFTITEVKGYAYLCCRVSDDLGGRVDLYMEINVANGLRANVAGTDSTRAYYFDSSAPQTLTVEASANEGDLTYQWYKREYGGNSVAVSSDGPSLFVGADTKGYDYYCVITDIYGATAYVSFYFRQGMAKELTLRTETTVESDPVWGESYVSFTPENTGHYTLKSASGDPSAWCTYAGQNYYYWVGFPASFAMEAGKTYYFVISSNANAFTLHLTVDRSGFRTFEELQALLEDSTSGEQFYYEGSADPFVIPENVTIPTGVSVHLDGVGVEIAAIAMLTVEEDALLYCDDLTLKGKAQVNGQISCTSVSGKDKIAYGENGYLGLLAEVETEDGLRSVTEQAAANTDPHVFYDIMVEADLTITRNLTIPDYTLLNVLKSVILAPGVTLEIVDSPDTWVQIYGDGQLRVQGTLRNNGNLYIVKPTSLVLEEGGLYCGDGVIQAYTGYGKAKDYFPWAYLPEYSDYEITADGDWYFLSKKAAAEPGDVNGDGSINSKDLILLRKLLIGLPADDKIVAPDVNGDGSLDLRDLVRLRKLLAAQSAG